MGVLTDAMKDFPYYDRNYFMPGSRIFSSPPGPPPAPPIPPPPGPPGLPTTVTALADQLRQKVADLETRNTDQAGRLWRQEKLLESRLEEIARARAETVRAMDERNAAKRAEHLTAKLLVQAGFGRDEATKRAAAAESALRDAEAKTVDIGWRKNRLLDAITARGFTVEWQKDGTPTLLTREEIAKREEEAKRKEAGTLSPGKLSDMIRSLYGPGGMFGPDYYAREFGGFNILTSPYLPKDKVYLWDTRPGAVNYVSKDVQVPMPTKPEDRVISQQPAKPAERTADDYYQAAIKAVWGYPVPVEAVQRASDHMKGLVDAALVAELKKHPRAVGTPGAYEHCQCTTCTIYRERPWR